MNEFFKRSYSEILNSIKQYSKDNKLMRISILRNITLEPVFDTYIKYFLTHLGYNAEIKYGQFDNIMQEALGSNTELINNETEYVIIALNLEAFLPFFFDKYHLLTKDDIYNTQKTVLDFINKIILQINKRCNAKIFIFGFDSFTCINNDSTNSPQSIINDLNSSLIMNAKVYKNTYILNLSLILQRLGYTRFYDLRYWYIGRAPYSKEALKYIAFEFYKYIYSLTGHCKKCLIVDCDNVLWGGVIGEDGLGNIKLGNSYPGNIYQSFQYEIKKYSEMGVIIALCSKNNENDVWDVFNNHPQMILKKDNISAYKINWDNKAYNINLIAAELNISLDSILFIDDSKEEILLINETLPDVETLLFDTEHIHKNKELFCTSGLFNKLDITEEDKIRGKFYLQNNKRLKALDNFTDLDSYYKSLHMKLEIVKVDDFYIQRISQLTQRTNQFNLSTKRYTNDDISQAIKNRDIEILAVKLSDKFGQYGTIGCAIIKECENYAILDTFLLSCRALGKKVEYALLSQIFSILKSNKKNQCIVNYYPTPKNAQVKTFLDSMDFTEVINERNNIKYIMNLSNYEYKRNDIFEKIDLEV